MHPNHLDRAWHRVGRGAGRPAGLPARILFLLTGPLAPEWIAGAYLLLSALWVGGSDWLFASLWPERFPLISLYKGWGFVAVTAVLLYGVLKREDRRRQVVERALRDLAHHDPLTGLPNRHCFDLALDRAVAHAAREDRELAVLFVDLDDFKLVNDRFGHDVGDKLLIEVAARLRRVTRSADTIARLGGDEFVILAVNGRHGAETITSRLAEVMAIPAEIDGHSIAIGASVGYAVYPEHGAARDDLLRAADQAMYRAKASLVAAAVG